MNPVTYTRAKLEQLKPTILAVCEEVAKDNPTAWKRAHDGTWSDDSARYNDLCVQKLRSIGIFAGRNGKRGSARDWSDDVLAFGLMAGEGGAKDMSERFPEMAIIDFIGRAGAPDAYVTWNDVSKEAPGRFLEPQGLPRVDGWVNPPVTPITPTTPPVHPPVATCQCKAQPCEAQAAKEEVQRLRVRLDEIADHVDGVLRKLVEQVGAIAAKPDFNCKLRNPFSK